ncbi:MAG: Gfo/Idh/MocA family oxidoreductase [Natronomonas sp.]|uniref:Gfo/Idh/MocA family protein n=1 Tax=Natronomonas sp. TaxID=2184060 RepID=UPI00286FB0AD|nr:Gfo/Idh/MocA family oxidoreductase [Natronomonas sp.]MDR9431986.1 Gfo/Idh/MocA family oxidoreductase [Natronomonas sp.]
MSESPAVGYVGLHNHHAGPYLETLATFPVEVTSACAPAGKGVPDIEALPDVPVYDDPESLLDVADVDVLWLTLPNRDAPAVIDAATERGVDVFTEKPAARTADDLRPVAERVRDREATVCPAYVWRGHPIARDVRDRAREGFFGTPRAVEARYVASALRHRDASHYLFDAEASRGGILQWLGVHWIDLVPWLLDDPIVAVNAQVAGPTDGSPDVDEHPTVDGSPDVEDGATVQFRSESGALGTLQCGYYLREGRYDADLRIYGDDGRCSWDPLGRTFGFDGETRLELEDGGDEWPSTPTRTIVHEYDPAPGYGGSWGREYVRRFLAAREGEGTLPADLSDALTVLSVLDAAYESAAAGEWVRVEN